MGCLEVGDRMEEAEVTLITNCCSQWPRGNPVVEATTKSAIELRGPIAWIACGHRRPHGRDETPDIEHGQT
jgi:hypothetical protein